MRTTRSRIDIVTWATDWERDAKVERTGLARALKPRIPRAGEALHVFETLRCDFKNFTILSVPTVSRLQRRRGLRQRMRGGFQRQRTADEARSTAEVTNGSSTTPATAFLTTAAELTFIHGGADEAPGAAAAGDN